MIHRELPTQEELLSKFDYSLATGNLYHKKSRHKSRVGAVAGTTTSQGYRNVCVGSTQYKAHRVIWLLVTGEDPGEFEVDHRDGDPANNAWHNLRLATRNQNQYNKKTCSHSSTGFKGVVAEPRNTNNPWAALISIDGDRIRLGYFHTPEEAHAAYCKAAVELHGEFARTQ
jgi:hypothetical protein